MRTSTGTGRGPSMSGPAENSVSDRRARLALARRHLLGEEDVELGGNRLELDGVARIGDQRRERQRGLFERRVLQKLHGVDARAFVGTGQLGHRLIERNLRR